MSNSTRFGLVAVLVIILLLVSAFSPWQEAAAVEDLTPELIIAVVAAAIALILDLVPGLRERWEALPKEVKRFAWLIGCLLVGLAPWVLACLGVSFWVVVACTPGDLIEVLKIAFLAYFASQSAHGVYKVAKTIWSRPRRTDVPF